MKEKIESRANELEREKRIKTKAFEDAEKGRLEALIPVKSSLEEEISQIRDESEAATRRIEDLREELRKETFNAERRENETNEMESVVLPECKKICAESMLEPAHARKKLDETTETVREEKLKGGKRIKVNVLRKKETFKNIFKLKNFLIAILNFQ